MSWPTWPATAAPMPTAMTTPVQSTLLPTAINSAPAVIPPNLQYSPEQWAQAQQQNWHQWAQWQQQYQQWHQQYGAEYQKSISAMQGTVAAVQQPPLPTMPNTGVPPPLPAENKPPLPPDDPPPVNQQSSMVPSYSTMPPKPVQTAGYTTGPPPLMAQQMQPPPQITDQYAVQRQNWQQQPPQQNSNKRPFGQGSEYENPKRPLLERPNQWGGQKQSAPNQWQNRPPQNVSYHTQPPPQSQPTPKQNVEELSEAEKKFDKEFAAWEAQFNKWKEQNANHPDKTQYREYEKKWQSWRNSLLERREQMRKKRLAMTNAGNKPYGITQPSVPQDMGLVQDQGLPKPDYSVNQPAPLITQPALPINKPVPSVVGDNFINNPPPNLNQEAVNSKATVPYPPEESAADTGEGFLKSSFSSGSGGIPGLDLVKEDENMPQKEDLIVLDTEEKGEEIAQEQPKPKGPDFDAISKGINTILGDQKLLSMLSIVSQNPPSASAPNTTTDSISDITSLEHNFSAPPPPPQKFTEAPPHGNFSAPPPSYQFNEPPPQVNIPYNDQSNHSYEDRSNKDHYQARESVNNFDDQTRSSFTMGSNDQDIGFAGNNLSRGQNNKFGPGRFGGVASENDRISRNNFGTGVGRPGGLSFGANIADKKFGPNRGEFGAGNFARDDNFKRDSFARDDNFQRDSFNKGNNFGRNEDGNHGNDYNNHNRDFQSDDFEEGNNFSCANDSFNRPRNNFKQLDQFASLDNFKGRRGGGDNFGGNSSFKRNKFNDDDGFNDDYNEYQDDDYNQGGDYDDNDYNEYDDYEKYHEMYNDEDGEQDFPKQQNKQPFQSQGPPPGSRQFQGPPPGPRPVQGPPSGPRQIQGLPLGPTHVQVPLLGARQVQGPPPGPLGRSINVPPNQRQVQGILPGLPVGDMSVPPPITPDASLAEENIFEPSSVIDYDHKSLKPAEPEVVVEPIHMFDYRHKPLNRIPLPQRPAWLSEAVKFIREFDPLVARVPLSYERPPPLDRYNSREVRREEWRPDVNEDRYGTHGRPERDRRHPVDFDNQRMDRRPYRDEPRFDRDFKENDDRNRHNFNDKYGRRSNENSRTEAPNSRKNIDFEEFSDDDMDFESDEVKKHQQNRVERSLSESPILSNPPNPATTDITMIEDIINLPGRLNRPPRIVIILRGPPGSGKTFLAKLIKDKEVENGGSAPRILSLDDYFMVEHEKQVLEDGKMIKVKEMVYEYEAEMEESYRTSFIKSFKKTITDGYFPFIIVDNINDKVKYFGEMWSFAKQNGFQVYVCQLDLDPAVCTKRNIHNRSEAEIEECIAGWEPTPGHHPSIDASGLLQASVISDVEMEEVEQPPEEATTTEEVPEDEVRSKWDTFDCSSNNLAKLDGVSKPLRPSRTMEEYLQLENEYEPANTAKPGQKRVRWADLEEQRKQKKMRAIGFIVGHTNWDRMMDPTEGGSALTKTKYIERVNKF